MKIAHTNTNYEELLMDKNSLTEFEKAFGEKFLPKNLVDFEAANFTNPVHSELLKDAVAKILNENRLNELLSRQSSVLFLKVDSRLVKIEMKNIYVVEALADYAHIHTSEKRYTVHTTMKSMEKRLPAKDFVRVHKSYIVRIDRISEIEKDTLMVEKRIIPIGHSYKKPFFGRLEII